MIDYEQPAEPAAETAAPEKTVEAESAPAPTAQPVQQVEPAVQEAEQGGGTWIWIILILILLLTAGVFWFFRKRFF